MGDLRGMIDFRRSAAQRDRTLPRIARLDAFWLTRRHCRPPPQRDGWNLWAGRSASGARFFPVR